MVVRLGVSDGRIVQELRHNHATAYGRHLQKLFTQRGSTCTEFIYLFRLNHLARFLDRRAPTPRRRVTLETAQCALVPKRVRPGLTTSSLQRFISSAPVKSSCSRRRHRINTDHSPSEVDIHRGLRDVSVALIVHTRRCTDAYEYCA
jgi:hypothetical protein